MACGSCPSDLPPVSSDYSPRGSYETVADMKTYFTGSSSAKKAIIVIHDIYGLQPSTLQGADRLAQLTRDLVIVPDFFKGSPLPLGTFPLDTEEKKKIMQDFSALMNMATHVSDLNQVVNDLTEKRGITTWGSFGLCFGGMVTALVSVEGSKFKASGTAHPGRPNPEDAKKIVIPYICLFSKDDGDPETIKEYGEILQGKPDNVVEHYSNMHHGWMAARANLKDEENVKEFERGWNQTAEFFIKNL